MPCPRAASSNSTSNFRPILNFKAYFFPFQASGKCNAFQLVHYVDSNSLIPPSQSGFTKFYSTETFLVRLLTASAGMPWRRGDDPFVCSAIVLYSVFAARQSVRSAFVLACERNLLIGMCFMFVSSLRWYWVGTLHLPSFVPGVTLQRTISVCVTQKDDFIIIWCEEHQPVVEACT